MGRPVSLATKDRDLVDYYAIANMEVEVAQDFAEVQKQEIYHYCKAYKICSFGKYRCTIICR